MNKMKEMGGGRGDMGGKEEGQVWRMEEKVGEKPVWRDRRLSLPTLVHTPTYIHSYTV